MARTTDMALNHGTYCSSRCAEVLARYGSRTSLRSYPTADNAELRRALATHVGVAPENILVANGSGPLLKTVIPFLVEREIRASPLRSLRHVLRRSAYPLVTTRLTYSKVPAAAVRVGLSCELLALEPEKAFALDVDELDRRLAVRAGLVYLCTPNNPTGNLLLERNTLERLLGAHPKSWFCIDEAYVHYMERAVAQGLPELVTQHPNLAVFRSFSFAYGLGSVRVGFVVASADVVRALDEKQTPHRVGQLASDLVVASLADDEHVAFVREQTRVGRDRIGRALAAYPSFTVYPSETNFILVRTRAPWNGRAIFDGLAKQGIGVKIFEPFGRERYDDYFRITVGLPEENDALITALGVMMAHDRQGRAA